MIEEKINKQDESQQGEDTLGKWKHFEKVQIPKRMVGKIYHAVIIEEPSTAS